jgi:uncharacterized GH25 family protein
MSMRRTLAGSIALAALIAADAAAAHGIWVAQRHDDWAVVYGHGASDEGYDPVKLTAVAAFDAAGKSVAVEARAQNDHVLLDVADGAAIVTATFDNGFWSERPDGTWVNEPKSAVPGAKQSGHYVKYTTTILRPLAAPPAAMKLPLEIVPLVDPMTLAVGEELPIGVFYGGAPLVGATVIAEYTTASDERDLKTDDAGEAVVTVRNQGLNVVAVSHSVATPDFAEADQLGLFATLGFTLDFHAE